MRKVATAAHPRKKSASSSSQEENANSSSQEKVASSSSQEKSGDSSSSQEETASSSSQEIISSSSHEESISSSSLEESSSSSQEEVTSSSSLERSSSSVAVSYGTMTDARDSKKYKTVTIGEGENAQTWMAENLNYSYTNVKYMSYCPNNTFWSSGGCATYGRLYTWAAALDSATTTANKLGKGCGTGVSCTFSEDVQGICPAKWHLPTAEDWETLFENVGGASTAGAVLKAADGWNDNGNGEDLYGFSAYPAGTYDKADDEFYEMGDYAYFWTVSGGDDADYAYGIALKKDSDEASSRLFLRSWPISVRCIYDW